MNLVDYTGLRSEKVKVGTYFRAKGLDFKHVLLPRWELLQLDSDTEESDTARRERLERDRRTLFVAMTRARDGLWLGSLDLHRPSRHRDSRRTVTAAEPRQPLTPSAEFRPG